MTAQEFIDEKYQGFLITDIMIEFAKLHVTEALKQASEQAHIVDPMFHDAEIYTDSILNAYPLENIK